LRLNDYWSELAQVEKENAWQQMLSGVVGFFASELAPTLDFRQVRIAVYGTLTIAPNSRNGGILPFAVINSSPSGERGR
jgi:hypothetical protein